MVVQRKLFTVEEFWRLLALPENQEGHLELIDGEIVEVSPKLRHGRKGKVLFLALGKFLEAHPIGEIVFEVDFYLPDDPHNTRRPDIAFISNERLATLETDDEVPFMPDLAIEIKSPSNYYTGKEGLREKALYYLANGSRLVWLVDPDKGRIEVYALGQEVVTLTADDTLDGGDVLPGFRLKLRELFSK